MKCLPILFVLLVSLDAVAADDSFDAAIATKCPAAASWLKQQKALHPERSEAAIARDDAKRTFTDQALRDELHKRALADKQARQVWIDAGMAFNSPAAQAVAALDADNLAWLKPRITASGFPTVAAVGGQGVADAWILSQHADSDPAFQAMVLKLVEPLAESGDVTRSDFAMLTDRVLRGQDKPQRYGSQYMRDAAHPDVWTLQPTEDVAHLDQRRAKMGLMPRAANECVLRVVYTPKA
jgi:hypothetical protein